MEFYLKQNSLVDCSSAQIPIKEKKKKVKNNRRKVGKQHLSLKPIMLLINLSGCTNTALFVQRELDSLGSQMTVMPMLTVGEAVELSRNVFQDHWCLMRQLDNVTGQGN